MQERPRREPDNNEELVLADLAELPLESVFHLGDSALDGALRRLYEDMGRPGESYAAHGTTP
jgi:hypothetical protein